MSSSPGFENILFGIMQSCKKIENVRVYIVFFFALLMLLFINFSYLLLLQDGQEILRCYEKDAKESEDLIKSMKECIQTIMDNRKMERAHANKELQKVTEEMEKVKEELKLVKVDLCYQKAILATLKRNHPYIFEKKIS